MIKTLIFIVTTVLFCPVYSQPGGKLTLFAQYPIVGKKLSVDNLGNFYITNAGGLTKYENNGNVFAVYSNAFLGPPKEIDVSNPLKILLFYPGINQLIFLDRSMTPTASPIMLEELDLTDVATVCTSGESGFWVFNSNSQSLIKYNANLESTIEAVSIDQLTNTFMEPVFMREYNNYIFLSDPNKGIFIFNLFGTFIKKLPFKNVKKCIVRNQMLVFLQNDSLILFHLQTLQQKTIQLPLKNIFDFDFQQKKLYLLTKNELKVYDFQ